MRARAFNLCPSTRCSSLTHSVATAAQHSSGADKILFIPDALIYMLTGEAVCEYTVASTSQLLNPLTGDLDEALLASVGLTRQHFGRLVQPGERVGCLTPRCRKPQVSGHTHRSRGSHDTASAVAAVPAKDTTSPTSAAAHGASWEWESPAPIITADSYAENFTNEGGLDHTTRFLKNITGLWIYEQCRKEWRRERSRRRQRPQRPLPAVHLQSLINPGRSRASHIPSP